MKKLMRDIWLSWHTWLFLTSMVLIAVGTIWMAAVAQRRDYQRISETGLARAVEEMRHEIRSLRAADEKSTVERQQIKRDVQEVKEAVEQ